MFQVEVSRGGLRGGLGEVSGAVSRGGLRGCCKGRFQGEVLRSFLRKSVICNNSEENVSVGSIGIRLSIIICRGMCQYKW